jgi:hypothetical protein
MNHQQKKLLSAVIVLMIATLPIIGAEVGQTLNPCEDKYICFYAETGFRGAAESLQSPDKCKDLSKVPDAKSVHNLTTVVFDLYAEKGCRSGKIQIGKYTSVPDVSEQVREITYVRSYEKHR